jgi:hypothetical protein
VQPVFDRAFACLERDVGDRGGCIRGRPRARLTRTGSVGDMGASSATDSSLTSASWSSVSSSFGTISVELVRVSSRDSECTSELLKMEASKLGVVIGESLADDIEGCGEELVLRRAFAPGGEWPKERVEIIRSSNWGVWLLVAGSGRHLTFSRSRS